jgi:23S rRNA maturation mini-RNase III
MALDMETAHTIGAVAIAIINALPDEGYNAAVETLHRYACDETRTEKQRSLFGSLVHVLTAPIGQLAEENEQYEKRDRNFTVITGGAA